MGNVNMEAYQVRFKNASYRTVEEGLTAALEGGGTGELDERVTALETTVGDAEGGLVKDVDDLETAVGDAEGGLVKDVADLTTAVSKLNENVYSTDEVEIGTYDGLKLYRKMFKFSHLPNSGSDIYSFGLKRQDVVIRRWNCFARASGGYWEVISLPTYDPNAAIVSYVKEGSGNIMGLYVQTSGNYYGFSGEITVEYTKVVTPSENNNR